MARCLVSILALVATIGCTAALSISEWKSISSDKGVYEDWAKLQSNSSLGNDSEDFGLVYASDKLYLVSRLNGSAVQGGIVSTLANGTWKHAKFDRLDDAQYSDQLFTLAGRMLLLTVGVRDGRVAFNKLFHWDDASAAWIEIPLNIPDKDRVFQKLDRSPLKFVTVDVPDQDGKTAYLVATDHNMAKSNSETSFSKLDLALDGSNKPLNASIVPVFRGSTDANGKAVIAAAAKDSRLYALMATIADGSSSAKISIDYSIDLATGNKTDGIKFDNSSSTPEIDYTANRDRIFHAKDMVLFLGPHTVIDDAKVRRHVWYLDLAKMKYQDVDAVFPNLPNRIFAIDQKNMRILTAGLKKGAFAASITADGVDQIVGRDKFQRGLPRN